jgi:nucleotidyltransferase/DNA polymerase involved in DNA repair
VTRSHTAKAFTASKAEIVNRAQMLLERTEADRRPVRLLGVGAHGLQEAE